MNKSTLNEKHLKKKRKDKDEGKKANNVNL